MGFVPQDDEFDVDAAAASVLDGSYFDDPPIAPKAPAKPRWAGKSALTQAELEDVLREAGWDEKDVPRMSAIGMAEAALTPDGRAKIDSYNPGIGPGGRPTVEESIGPWQINMHPSLGRKYDRKRLASDPVYNAKAALDIYKEQGLRAWGAYTNGRYKKHYKKTGQVGPAAAPFDPDKAAAELLRGIPGFDPEVAVPGPVTETAATLDAQRQAARDPQSTRIAVLYTDGATAPELEVGEYDVQLPNGQILRADAVKLTEYLKTTGTALADIRSGAADFTPLIGGKAEPTGEQYGTEGQVAVISYDEDGNELISSSITDPANIPVEAALQKKQFPGRKIRTEVGTAADVINAREPVAAEDDGFAEANAFLVSQGQPQLTREEFDARSQNFGSDVEVDSYQIRSGDQSDELQQVAPKRPSNSSAPQPKVAGKIGGGIYRNVAVKQTDLRDATDPNQYASQQAAYAMADELGVSRSTADEWLAKKGYNILQNGGFTEYEVSLAEEGKSVNININNSLAKEFAKFAGKEKDFVPNIEIGEFDDLTKVTKAIDQMMYSQQNIEPLRTEEEAEESISKRIKDKDYSATQWASEILSNPLNLVFTPALMYNVATKETVSDEWQQQEKKRLKDQYGSFKSADVAEKYYQGMSWGETAVRFTGQVARSFAKNLVGGTGKSIAYLGQITEDVNPLNKALPGELKVGLRNMVNAADFIAHLLTAPDLASAQKDMKWAGPEEVNKQQLFRAMEEFDKTVGDDPVLKGRLLGSFADAGGSALAFVALGAAAPSLGTSKLLGFTLDRSTALIGGLQMAGAGYEEAKKAGLSETDARFHGLTSFLLGGTEALGAGADLIKLLRSGAAKKAGIEKQLIGGLLEVAKKKAKAIGTKVAAEAKQEFAQEVFQTTAGGAVLEYLKDNDPSTLKKLTNALNRLPKQFGSAVANEGLIALVTGGLMGGATATAQQLANKMAGVEEKGNPVPVNPAILGDFSEKGRQEFFAAVDEKLAGLVADGEITQVDADGAAARAREIANMSPKKAIQAMQEILEAPATEVATEEPVPAEKLTGSRVDRYVPEVTAVNETGLSTITDKEGTEFTVLEDRGEKGLLVQDSKGAQKIWPERKFNAGDLAAIREAGLKSVPVDQGETRVVYRLGWANETDPSGRYVGDADRVAAHINKTEEGMKGAGDTLFAYRVPVSELLWDKQNLGNAAILPEGSKAKLISQTPYADQYGTGKAKTGEEWSMFEVAGDHIRKTFKQEKQAPPTRFSTPKINTVSQIKKGAIPEDPWAWFNRDVYDAAPAISTMVDPDKVILTKSRERMDRDEVAFGGKHELVRAYNHLLDQADGSPQGRKRDPIEVYKNEDGTFTVADGNATVQLAQMLGWKQVPAVITKKPIGTVAPVNEKIAQLSRDVLNEAEGLKHDYFRDVRQAAAVAGGFVPATIRQYLTKSIKSLNKKLAFKSGAVPTDLIRSTIVIPTGSPADAEARAAKVVEAMGRLGYKVLKDEKGQPDVTNRFADPAPGYKDIAIKFVKDDSPAVHELQLLQPATFTAKTGIWVDPVKGQYRTTKRLAQHINYDKVKDLQDAIANDPFLTPRRVKDLLADIVEINAAMAKAYAASFAKDTGLRASDSSTYRPSETIDASSLSSTGTPSKSRNRKNASGDVLSEVVAKNLATDSLSSTERALKFFNDSDIYTSSSIVADDESNSKGLESPLKKVDPDRTGSALGVFTEPKVEKGRSAQKAVATITKPELFEDAPLKSVSPPKTAKITDLVLDPAGVSVAKATYLWQGGRSTNTNPIAVEMTPEGKYHVLDGYHRVAQAKRDGKDEIAIRVVELVNDKYEDAPLKSVTPRAQTPFGTVVKSLFKTDKVMDVLLDSEAQSGPFDGGCLICAKGLIQAVGRGKLVRIVSNSNGGQTEHYGAEIDGVIYDADGSASSPEAWIDRFAIEERIKDRKLSFDRGYDEESEIPDDPRAVKDLAKQLRRNRRFDQAVDQLERLPLKSVAPLKDSLGIPRSEMPQIRRDDHAEFIEFAKDRGVDIVEDSVRAGDLLPTQNEYNPEQAAQLPDRAFDKRLMVSADNRVLDGHNTLVRLQEKPDQKVDIWRIDLPATTALGLMKDFPKVGYKTVAEVGPTGAAKVPQTETEAFEKWFKDSKVVNEKGEPLMVYHGTSAQFDTFEGDVTYLSASPEFAGEFGGLMEPLYVSLQNPYDFSQQPGGYYHDANGELVKGSDGEPVPIGYLDAEPDIVDELRERGFDGAIDGGFEFVVAFDNTQIKSAENNSGNFDANDPSILKKAKTAESQQLRMELELAYTDEVVKRLSGGTLHTNGELELNEADAELLRRLIAERYFQRTGKTIDEMPFDGIMWNSAYMRNLAQFGLTTGREQLVEAGFTEDQIAKADELMNKLIETADTNEGHAIAYVYDEALPHERTHKEERGLGGVPKGVEAKLLALPIAQTVGTAFDRAYPNISSQDKVSELAAIIATGDAAKYGLSTDTAAQQEFLHMWARGIIDNNIEQINEIGPQAWAAQYPIISGIAFATSQGEQNAENNQSAEVGTARDQETGGSSAISGAGVQGAAGRAQAAGQEQAPASQTANSEQGQPPVSPDAEIAQLTGQTVTEVKTKNRQFAQSLASSLFDIGNVEYEPQTVKGWEDGAAETIEEKGLDGAIDEYHRMPAGSSEGRKTALGVAIAVEMYTEGRTAELVSFGTILTENIGNAAQELRAAALLSRLSPAFAAITGNKIVMKAKFRPMDGQERTVVDKLARELEEAADAHAFAQAALAEATGLNEKFAERVKELETELDAARKAPSGNSAANEKALADALALAEEYKRKLDAGKIKVKGPKALKDLRVEIETERPDLVALLQAQFPGTALKLPAHHGTPHVFKAEILVEYKGGKREFIEGDVDKLPKVPKGARVVKEFPHGRFNVAKLGSGEGHQAFGHGLYFSSQEKIADWYREELSKGIVVSYDGKEVDLDRDRKELSPKEIAIRNVAGMIAHSDARDVIPADKMIASAKWGVQKRIDYAEEWIKDGKISDSMRANYEKDVETLRALDKLDPSKFEHKERKGARYNVDLKPDETEYLDWDKSYNEQSDSVKKALGSPEELVKSLGGAISTIDWFDGPVSGEDVMDWKGIPKADQDKLWRELPQWQRDAGMKEYRAEHSNSVRAEIGLPYHKLVGVGDTKREAIGQAMGQLKGQDIYRALTAQAIRSLNYGKPSQEFASNWLLQRGIKGNRYLDGNSRNTGEEGNHNYVIFNDRDVAIESVLKSVSMPDAPLNVSGFDQAAFFKERDAIPLVQDKAGKLLAPNGKVSNIQNKDLWRTIRTKGFLEFFGDWVSVHNGKDDLGVWQVDADVSKAVDENGEPAIMYHGTKQAGFGIFDPSMGRKVPGAIFWTTDREMARSYSGTRDEAEIQSENVNDADIAEWWSDEGGANEDVPFDELTPDKQEEARARYKDEILDWSDEIEPRRGIYSAFLNIRNPNETDFEGANWDGSREGQWSVETDDGDILYHPDTGRGYFSDRLDAVEVKRLHLEDGSKWSRDELHISPAQDMHETTDSVAKDAKRYGNDGALIRDVSDPGGEADYYGTATVIVTFEPTQIKSIFNRGSFDPQEEQILKSVSLPDDLAIKPEVAEALIKVAAAKLIDDVPTGLTPTAFDKWLNEITNNQLGAREIAVIHALAHEMSRPVYEPKDLDQKFHTKNRIAHKQRADRILIAEGLTDVTPEGIAEYKEAHTKQGPKRSEGKWPWPKAGPRKPGTLANRVLALGEDLGVDEQTVTMAVAQMAMPDDKRLRQIYNAKFPDGGAKGYAAAMNAGKQLVDMARDQATAEKWEAKAGEGATKKEALDLERAMKDLATEERLKRKALEAQFKRLAETGTDKVLGGISSAYNLPRSVMFSGDLGFLLAQGLPTLLMHPTAWWKAVSTGIPAALTDKRFERAITEAYNSTWRKTLEAGGTKFEQIGNIADFNDDFMSDVARHIPFVKQTNRAHSLTTDLFRLYGGSADLMELDAMYEAGKLGKTPEESARNYNRSREFLAKKWTNVMSGKGYLGALDVLGKGMAQVGSAPRYTVSAFQMPYYANPLRAAFLPKGARKIMMKNSAKIWIPIIGLMLLLSKLGLINDDPEDKDFLQIDAGKLFGIEDMNINPLRALKEPVRLTVGLPLKMLYYQVTGNRDGVARIAKSYYAAFVIDSYGGMGSFWKSKLHPTLSMASMAITGKNFVGEPAGWMDIVPLPLGIKESYQAATYDRKQSILKTGADTGKIQDNWRRVLATFVGSSIGWGVNSFPGSDTTIATKQLLSMKGGPNDDPRTDEERIADGDPTSSQSQKANQIERLIREGADVLEIMQASISSGQITKKQAEQLAATLIDDLGNVEKRLGTSFTDGQKAVLMNNRQALKILDYLYTDKNLDWRKIDKALKLSTPRENYLNDRAALAAAEAIVLEAVLRGDRITDPMTTDKMVEMYKGLAPNMTVADRDEFLQRLEKKARNSNKLGKLDPEELEKVKEVIPGIGIVPRAPGTPGPVYKIQEIGSMEKALINPAVKRWSTDDWVVVLQSKLTAKDRALAEEALKKKAENARKSKTLTQEEVGRINSVLPNFKIQADSSRGSSTTKKDDRSPSKWDGQRQSENVIDQREEN